MYVLTKKMVVIIVVLVLLILGIGWHFLSGEKPRVSYRTAEVKRGDIVATISGATGTVEPEEVVDVGAQVAGRIDSFGTDKDGKTIDYGSIVENGTILAQIDDSLYAADVAQSQAALIQAQAGVKQAEANLEQLKAKLYQAQRDWQRAQKLGASEALSQVSYDTYQSDYEIAVANVTVGKAAIDQAQAVVAQAQATLERSQRNLGYCTIKSPVQGVIIDRRVNIGQTVVSSLNAPSLFLIAKDLKRMQIWVSVNEAYITSIHSGQPVSFTVDAYPGEIFRGQVGKVRLNASMTQNVVMYVVEVVIDNSNGKLLPYLTATADFELERRNNVLLVPNEALRWTPQADQVSPKYRSSLPGSNSSVKKKEAESQGKNQGTVWVQDGDYVRPVVAGIGLSDGSNTQILSDEVKEGQKIIVGEKQEQSPQGQNNAASPFTPQLRKSRTPSNQ